MSKLERSFFLRLLSLYNKGMGTEQGNRNFLVNLSSNYLVVPNNRTSIIKNAERIDNLSFRVISNYIAMG